MQHFDIVIIGNSAAGLQAIRTLRRLDRLVSLALIDREPRPAYSRVLTPYYVGGKTSRENLYLVEEGFYPEFGVTPLLGATAVSLDPERHQVRLDDGRVIGFGKLLIATGGEARPLAGASARVCTLRHLSDAERLRALIASARCVTALGAGLVSVPVLSHLPPGVERHLVVGSDRVFSRLLDAESALLLEEHFAGAGVQLHKRDDVVSLDEGERLELRLASGTTIPSDLLVVGKGVRPNTDLARGAGLPCADGVLIDDYCRTAHPDVYAAGDVAQGKDLVTGEPTVQGNWITAVEQGEHAALNMLGSSCAYRGSLKNNTTEVFGLELAVLGYCQDDAPQTVSWGSRFSGRFRKAFLDEQGRVIGASLIGETNDAGVYYQMILGRMRLPSRRLLQGANRHAAVQLYLG
ncbi:pyridine nucleotide-disulfide oxidoreductase [Geomonas silvestris]|uniref:Pyridine nucleotide-disulfide oxidoreductase n=1 Tax=Geomonas silvestris TaxID=2740184 RepID=A0A6V8MM14_9BACT|nr:FAD-dependent oxidoreductase [Geomonas silvestris]GFO61091.1 pyridine nucleotide-disulfide oxidoreductase [Geomonas silvestris]